MEIKDFIPITCGSHERTITELCGSIGRVIARNHSLEKRIERLEEKCEKHCFQDAENVDDSTYTVPLAKKSV